VTRLAAGGASDVGRVRQSNQDCYFIGDDLFVVADGVGGHRGGEVASATAVEALRDNFVDHSLTGLIQAVLSANRAVWRRSQADPQLRGMGTTLTAVALVVEDDENRLALVNVGDSRGYLLQDGELSQLTEDHSLVEELVREGRLSREEADVHPQRSMITRALGLEYDVEVDNWQLLPYPGDRLLLCSDGLTSELSDDRIASVLRRLADPAEAAGELVEAAKAAGGHDNVTVVVVDVVNDDDAAAEASAALAGQPLTAESHPEAGTAVDAGAAPPAQPAQPAKPPRPSRGRRLTWRVVAFAAALLLVVGAATAAVGWYARHTYFVGTRGSRVAIFKGRPGGLLWFDPTLEQRSDLAVADVPENRRADVHDGKQFADLAGARRYVANLKAEAAAERTYATTPTSLLPPATATTTATTTTGPKP
jgi:PPM family protein phosphatase